MKTRFNSWTITTLLLLALVALSSAVTPLKEVYRWKNLDWEFLNDEARRIAIDTGFYTPVNSLPVGVVRWRDRLFVTAPRWGAGVPASLNTISLNKNTSTSPRLRPYPDWSWHLGLEQCEGITSVIRIAVDQCDRLWVADDGEVSGTKVCPERLLVFDLNTDRVLVREDFPKSVLAGNTNIVNVAVDYRGSCENTFAYFADLASGIIVYDSAQNKFWRHNHNFFYPDPFAGSYDIAGTTFQLMGGVFGLTLSPVREDGERFLYFNPLASHRIFALPTRLLQNDSSITGNFRDIYYTDPKLSQSTSLASTKDGVLFYGLLNRLSIACWNWKNPFEPRFQPEIDRNETSLQFPGDIEVDNEDNIWIVTNRYQRFETGTMDWNDVNYRILTVSVKDAIKGTACEIPSPGSTNKISSIEQK